MQNEMMGVAIDTVIAKAKNPASYIAPRQARVSIDTPYEAYQAIIGALGNGATGTSADALALTQSGARSNSSTRSIASLLRPRDAELFEHLLDTLSTYDTPTGPLLDQGVAIYCNQCATGAHSFRAAMPRSPGEFPRTQGLRRRSSEKMPSCGGARVVEHEVSPQ